jgi:hypothetical protein
MLICAQQRWIYVGIPKTGSRAVRDALLERFGDRIEERVNVHAVPEVPPPQFRKYAWIVSIRHPFARALSWYFHKRYWAKLVVGLPNSVGNMPEAARATYTTPKGQRNALGPFPAIWSRHSFVDCLQNKAVAKYAQKSLSMGNYKRSLARARVSFVLQERLEADLRRVHPAFDGLELNGEEYTHPYEPYPKEQWKRYYQESEQLTEQLYRLLQKDFRWLSDYYSKDLRNEDYTS